MLKIVTDGAVDMPASWAQEFDIQMIPLSVRFGERTYLQGLDLNPEQFYSLVRANHVIPKTSLPSPQQVADFYRKIAKKGDEILSIHVASKMSGTFATIQMAARDLVGELDIFPFDSGAGSAAQGFMCREARTRDRMGESVQDILKRLTASS
jgi:DegV family protein with EDD domain